MRISADSLQPLANPRPGQIILLRGERIMLLRGAEDPPEARMKFMALETNNLPAQFGIRMAPQEQNIFNGSPELRFREIQFDLPEQFEAGYLAQESVGNLLLLPSGMHVVCRREHERTFDSFHAVNIQSGLILDDRITAANGTPMFPSWKMLGRLVDNPTHTDWLTIAQWPRPAAPA